jgi:PAS domain S-box-containing protein
MDNNALVMADRTGVIRFWSPGAEAAFGHAAAQAVGQTLDLIVPAEHRDAHWIGFRRAVASGMAGVEGQTGPFAVLHANGAIAETPGTLRLVRQSQGEVVAVMAVFE